MKIDTTGRMKHCIVIATLVLCIPVLHAAGEPEDFRLISATGKVAVIPAGETEARGAAAGFPLSPGDRVVTGEGGTAELATRSGTVIRLDEKSSLGLDDVRSGWTTFRLNVGRFLGKFQKTASSHYRVKTPVAVASVRGTEFGLDVSESGELSAGVVEGTVAIQPADAPEDSVARDEAPATAETAQEMVGRTDETSEPVAISEEPAATWKEEVLTANQGVNVLPHEKPSRLNSIPKPLVASLAWFPAVRERIPKLRDTWKDLDPPSRLKLRQHSLRERIQWKAPARPIDRLTPPRERLPRSPRRPKPTGR